MHVLLSVMMLLLSLVRQPESGGRGETMVTKAKFHRCQFKVELEIFMYIMEI